MLSRVKIWAQLNIPLPFSAVPTSQTSTFGVRIVVDVCSTMDRIGFSYFTQG